MNKKINDILEEFKKNIITLTWRRVNDIYKAVNQNPDDYFVVYFWEGKICQENIDYYVWYYRKYMKKDNKKIVLVPKKLAEKIILYIKSLDRQSELEFREKLKNYTKSILL